MIDQMETLTGTLPETDARDTVIKFIKALNEEDFGTAKGLLSEYVKFVGTTGSRDGLQNYLDDLIHIKISYVIQKTFLEGEDVCVLYDMTISGIVVFACGWYRLSGNKISSIRVIFDPRKILNLTSTDPATIARH
jgi:hypothetical protein